jgi:hypothetical protein
MIYKYFNMKKLVVLTSVVLFFTNPLFSQNIESKYPYVFGHLRLSKNYSVFHALKNTEISVDTLHIFNSWDQAMTFQFNDIQGFKHLQCQAVPAQLAPNKSGYILIKVDGTQMSQFGLNNMQLGIYTNDIDQPVKRVTLSMNLTEDFSKMTEKQRANAPKASFNTTRHNFGTVKTGTSVKYAFEVKNTGKSELVIRRTSASCGCTATHPAKTNLQPGESTTIEANFNTSGRSGRQIKTITVITNDPDNASVVLMIEGDLN